MILASVLAFAGPTERTSRWIGWDVEGSTRGSVHAGEFARAPVLAWRVRLPGPPLNSASHTERGRAVIHEDRILVGSAAGQGLYAMSRFDGGVVDVYAAYASVESEPLVHEDDVFFADTSGTTYCYSLDGEKRWEHRGNAPILTRPFVDGDTLYITNVDDLVVALDRNSGEQLWRYQAKRDLTRVAELALYAAPGAVRVGEDVVVGFSSGALEGLDAATGTRRWTVEVGEGRYPDLVATPVADGSDLYVSGYFKPLVALDVESQNVRWRAEAGSAFPVTVSDGSVYHPGSDGVLRVYSALTGAERWRWESGSTAALTQPLMTQAGVLIAASSGSVYLLDPSTRKATWTYREPELLEGVTATPTIDGRQMVMVSNAGFLYSFVAPDHEPRQRPSNRTWFKGRP